MTLRVRPKEVFESDVEVDPATGTSGAGGKMVKRFTPIE